MEPEHDLIRAIANALRGATDFSWAVPTEEHAAAIVLRAAHQNACPACRSTHVEIAGPRHVRCLACGRPMSLTAGTPLHGTKLSLRLWVAAIWHLHVDTQCISARGFGRRYRLRAMTAWALLHRVREAFPRILPRERGSSSLVSAAGEARVTMGTEGDLAALPTSEAPFPPTPIEPVTAYQHGLLQAWLVQVFRGVTPHHFHRYLLEFTDRHGRVRDERYVEREAWTYMSEWASSAPA